MGPLPNGAGDLMTKDVEKAEVFNIFFSFYMLLAIPGL